MENKHTYSRDDLLAAWLASEEARDSHPDVADYYYRQAWALARAFEAWDPRICFTKVPREDQQLWTVFQRSIEAHNSIHGPWGYFLAGGPDPARATVEALHGPPIADACDQLRAAYRALLLDLLERIWDVGPDTAVSVDEVRAHGFDPDAPAPNFDLYW